MSYELADGSLSTDYEVGDEFVAQVDYTTCDKGELLSLDPRPTTSACSAVFLGGEKFPHGAHVAWRVVAPTAETKRKAQSRKDKRTINLGDYIDSHEFTREECERFCELAGGCGYGRGEWMGYFDTPCPYKYLGVAYGEVFWFLAATPRIDGLTNNITTQFREFLDKENSMFTKDDLKAEQTVTYRKELARTVFLDVLVYENKYGGYNTGTSLDVYNDDLTHKVYEEMDIMKVTDRDGTVLFERKETTELTMQEVADKLGIPVQQLKIKGE